MDKRLVEFEVVKDEEEDGIDELFIFIYYYDNGEKYEVYTHDIPEGLKLGVRYPLFDDGYIVVKR